ncbi:hypothetical protein [Chitinasiproducens palmae]|uniref:Uncharacterized protein n=1 Tax=Chitinasiproducens palmae TaxID=1770053 RepID=A0A1H2PV19_9BURK|nr:hypothetical protein [Chitinasiproducens palmae]SDV51120.1 hypothetical protein SAMN05216551_11540 [Chitinasiproducens palmae]
MANGLNKALSHLAEAFRANLSETRMYHVDSPAEVQRYLHGDRWQNVLASPMDARRYAMEEWNDTAECHDCEPEVSIDGYGPRRKFSA